MNGTETATQAVSVDLPDVRGTLTIAHLTWLETRRRRVALAAVICGGAFLVVFALAVEFAVHRFGTAAAEPLLGRRVQLQMLTLMGMYAVNFLTVVMAVLLPLDTLSGEISSGVMQTIASKPIGRVQIVVGKWLTHWLMSAGYLLLMSGGLVLIVRALAGWMPPNLERALPVVWLEATILVTLSIAGGTRFTTVTNGIVAFAFYAIAFISGWVEQIGLLLGNEAARRWGTLVSLIAPTDALWRLAAYELLPPIMNQLQMSPFVSVSVPTFAMVIWSLGWIVAMLAIAIRSFQTRPL